MALPTQKLPAKRMHKLVSLGFASRQVCKLVGTGGDFFVWKEV